MSISIITNFFVLAIVGILIFGVPVLITVLNIWNFFSKRKIIPQVLVLLTIILGILFYLIYRDIYSVTNEEWNTALYLREYHNPISGEYLISFIVLLALSIASLLILVFVPAKKLSPVAACFALAGILIGNVLNVIFALHVAPLFFKKTPPYIEGLIQCMPLLFHFNIFVLSLYYVQKQILEQIALMNEKIEKTNSERLKKIYSFLKKVSHWNAAVFVALIPLVIVLEIVLILFGQGADGPVKMFTMTADWTFSLQLPPPPLEYNGHYLCTVAAGGHKKVVKPLRFGKRRGATIIVNRQLMVANAFEELIAEKAPRFHKIVRNFYDAHGYPLSKIITNPFRADVVYFLMKPLEWLFAFTLYLFDTNPEERISRQYS